MFHVLVYLSEHYAPESCPEADVLAQSLSEAGFDEDDIDAAIDWLSGLAESTWRCIDETLLESLGERIFSPEELDHLDVDARGLLIFLESAGVLSAPLREIAIEQAMAVEDGPVELERMKIILRMVLWSQEVEPATMLLLEPSTDSICLLH